MISKDIYYVDKLLQILPSHEPFVLHIFINEKLKDNQKDEAKNLHVQIAEIMVEDFNYAFDYNGNEHSRYFLKLTNKGREAKELGGHFKYVAELKRIQKLNEDQIKSVVDTNKLTRKNIFATITIAFIVTIIQARTYYILEKQEDREERKLIQDSLQQLINWNRDSIIYTRPIQVNISKRSLEKK